LPEDQQAGSTPFAPRSTKDAFEEALFERRRDLFTHLELVFFDTTSIYFEGEGGATLGARGKSKDARPDLKQMVVGAVLDGDGRPIACELWPGNTTDVKSLVPIVEPEVLMDGSHTIERCEAVTGNVLHAVFNALVDHGVSLEGMLLKPNMVIPAVKCTRQASVQEVALATLRCLGRHVPPVVPGIVFLSGGQDHLVATAHLCAINQLDAPRPWKLGFSYGRALQDEALEAWQGKKDNLKAGQQAFYHRARCVSAAALGRYSAAMEEARNVS